MADTRKRKNQGLNGLNPLSYLGQNTRYAPDTNTYDRDPTIDDAGLAINDLWVNTKDLKAFILARREIGNNIWLLIGNNYADLDALLDDLNNRIIPDTDGAIKIAGGDNINTTSAANEIKVNLNKSIVQPDTNADGSEGLYTLGTTDFISNYGTDNTFLGGAGNRTLTTVTAVGNTAIGKGALASITEGTYNVALGAGALDSNTTGSKNIAIGFEALGLNTNGTNIAIGYNALSSLDALGNNTVIGTDTCGKLVSGSGTDGGQNTFVGNFSAGQVTDMTYCTGIGYDTIRNATTTSGVMKDNIAIGSHAGFNWTDNESNNITIGSESLPAENLTIRIGKTPDIPAPAEPEIHDLPRQTRCFIQGIRGITTGVNDAIPVVIDSNGQLGTVSSSIRFKENVEDMGIDSENIYNLRPVTFNYKKDASKKKQYGLVAEEVAEVFPQLAVKDHEGAIETVKYHELPILLLNEIIKLRTRVEELEKKLS